MFRQTKFSSLYHKKVVVLRVQIIQRWKMMSLTRTKYTLLQPCDSLREHRDILFLIVILNDFLYCTTLTLIFDVLSSLRLFYIQFKEVKVLWESGAGARGPDNPSTPIKVVLNWYPD